MCLRTTHRRVLGSGRQLGVDAMRVELMAPQRAVRRVGRVAAADVALERALPGMDPNVVGEVAARDEALVAGGARERLLRRMGEHVRLQGLPAPEVLAADVALVRRRNGRAGGEHRRDGGRTAAAVIERGVHVVRSQQGRP